ncbi:MAG: hypothetical protein CSA84_05285 [Actinomycetales bacterium]|nr:MAG: hypothetical protein CSA84_05285 [Actinomycetales bacterium]
MLAIVCPDQAALAHGAPDAWLPDPGFRSRMAWFAVVAGEAPDELEAWLATAAASPDTSVARSALVAVGLAAWSEVVRQCDITTEEHLEHRQPQHRSANPAYLAVGAPPTGAVTAAALAGVLNLEQAVVLARSSDRVRPGWVTNLVDGTDPLPQLLVADGSRLNPAARDSLGQLTVEGREPVVWDAVLRMLHQDRAVSSVIVLPPSRDVVAAVERCGLKLDVVAVDSPGALASAVSLLRQALGRESSVGGPEWRLVTAPTGGRLSYSSVKAGERVSTGTVLAHLKTERVQVEITAPHSGTVDTWLAQHGDQVAAGQPILRMGPG